MMDFPASPTLNQTFVSGDKSWTYNGSAWLLNAQPVPVTSPIDGMAFKNQIINPKLRSWQAGATLTFGPSTNAFGWGADRFLFQAYVGSGSGNNTISMTQQTFVTGQTDVPTNPLFFARIQASALGTQAAGAFTRVIQYVEDVRTMQGAITISFWAKADSVRTITVACQQNFGSGGSTATYTGGTVVLAAGTTWQRYSITLTIPSCTGKTVGGNSYTTVELRLHNADTVVPVTPNNWSTSAFLDFWGLTAEAGSVMTTYEDRAIYLEDLMIKRYVTTSKPVLIGRWGSATSPRLFNDFEVPMRRTPDVAQLLTTVDCEECQVAAHTMTSVTIGSTGGSERNMFFTLSGTVSGSTPTVGNLAQLNSDKVVLFRAEF